MTCIRQDLALDRVCAEPSHHAKVLYTVLASQIASLFYSSTGLETLSNICAVFWILVVW